MIFICNKKHEGQWGTENNKEVSEEYFYFNGELIYSIFFSPITSVAVEVMNVLHKIILFIWI